jgi:hypothetical protein
VLKPLDHLTGLAVTAAMSFLKITVLWQIRTIG